MNDDPPIYEEQDLPVGDAILNHQRSVRANLFNGRDIESIGESTEQFFLRLHQHYGITEAKLLRLLCLDIVKIRTDLKFPDTVTVVTIYQALVQTFELVKVPGKRSLVIRVEGYAQKELYTTVDRLLRAIERLQDMGWIEAYKRDYPAHIPESWEIVFKKLPESKKYWEDSFPKR